MSITKRLEKLEASLLILKPEPIKISWFIVSPGDLDPIGYRCGDVTTQRNHGETTEDLKKRCSAAVADDWAIFKPTFRTPLGK